eukprot:TRINITY_DN1021_c0_g3_i1.p2 TRINITY_DN1021_c0_g3~~TRINITY_DN1021_c0_g3_i1.p2  ORF type:complete len:139 (+),score=19.78 TRINITY_DN1021_c0_g3_i1:47-463(+)
MVTRLEEPAQARTLTGGPAPLRSACYWHETTATTTTLAAVSQGGAQTRGSVQSLKWTLEWTRRAGWQLRLLPLPPSRSQPPPLSWLQLRTLLRLRLLQLLPVPRRLRLRRQQSCGRRPERVSGSGNTKGAPTNKMAEC